MQNTMQQKFLDACELASALADGELQDAEFVQALTALRAGAEAQARWHTYHLVGDVLRSGAGAAMGGQDAAFMARLRLRLQEERQGPVRQNVPTRRVAVQESANDSVWRWKLLAGVSSLAVVAVLGWQLAVSRPGDEAAAKLARSGAPEQTPSTQLASADAPQMIRDPRLDQLIAAHQQLGGTSALQMPAGFLRNATFERPAR
jgi:sigma-E factor negative regulatory protein RseA